MNRSGPGATHHLACDCRERKWAERLAGADRALYAERERVVRAELRAASLSRELLDAMRARDSYRASAELRVGMRREFEELLNVGDTTAPETFEAGLVRLRALLAAESRAEKAEAAHAGCDAQVRELVSKALRAVRGQEAAESRAERLLTVMQHLLKAFLTLHRAYGTGSAEQWPEVEDARAALAEHRDAKGTEAGR